VTVPEYTVGGLVAVAVVVAYELAGVRSGVFRWRPYWLGLAICLGFMVLVNGWLTKLSAPIVLYAGEMKTPWRFPWDIPVEDYLFGFALLTAVAARWRAGAGRIDAGAGHVDAGDAGSDQRSTPADP
jgi:lycopene cyclase domain-containing protein